MTKFRSALIAVVAGLSALFALAPSANACGFIACVIEQVAPNSGVGEALDDANRDLGHPAEQILNDLLEDDE
jgi:hypothetical protein